MQNYDPIHRQKMVISLYCFSGSGHSRAIADYLAKQLEITVEPLPDEEMEDRSEVALVVFPVYSQNLPDPVKIRLPKIKAQRFILIATYGRMSFGNVLQEAACFIQGRVIAAAYVPTGHTYLSEGNLFEVEQLRPLLEKIGSDQAITLKPFPKNIFANFFPNIRSRLGVKIERSEQCNECGLCTLNCPMKTMNNGRIGHHCIRCLRCVNSCPQQALTFRLSPFLKGYLKRPKEERFLLFLN
ncbi:MAG: hypothetical protein J5554_05365 [Paludibacteraceae bacterium]|nr:hypothetical protein [Paludibacteraceae bacterium]